MNARPLRDFDVILVGAGHNALVCVVERRPVVGGAVVTEEIVPGYKFDLGGSAHFLINLTPIVADLDYEIRS